MLGLNAGVHEELELSDHLAFRNSRSVNSESDKIRLPEQEIQFHLQPSKRHSLDRAKAAPALVEAHPAQIHCIDDKRGWTKTYLQFDAELWSY